MPEDRAEMQEARAHGLKARHETREARAVRKATAEEIAAALADAAREVGDPTSSLAFDDAAQIAREIGSRDPA